tara:strand:+ start:6967 stop:7983 length:1017 start_codon:yes stop_codon:yes gene_type:complete
MISESKAQFSFEKISDYTIKIDENFILSSFLKGVMDKEGNIFYCDLTRILKFNSNGEFQKEIAPSGRGPGEFQTLIDCNVTENYLVVLPFNEFRALFFNKSDMSYSHEFSLESFRSRKFAIAEDSLLITINDVSYGQTDKTLSVYDIDDKQFLGANVDTPEMAYVGNTSEGGGLIAKSTEVFYLYISYPGIWRYNFKTGASKYYNSVPDYFEESNFKELGSLKIPNDHRYYRGYMYNKSRSEGIYFLGKDKVVQMIATGNPWKSGSFNNSEVKYYLEIWDTQGNKLASKVPTPNNQRIEFTHGDNIYFNTGELFAEESESLPVGSKLSLFEVYKMIAD